LQQLQPGAGDAAPGSAVMVSWQWSVAALYCNSSGSMYIRLRDI
jgi:hypothetical protein